jgi:hypothetical protein
MYMKNYGEDPEYAIADLNGLAVELNTFVHKLDEYLVEGLGQDLGVRLERLQWAGNEADLQSSACSAWWSFVPSWP